MYSRKFPDLRDARNYAQGTLVLYTDKDFRGEPKERPFYISEIEIHARGMAAIGYFTDTAPADRSPIVAPIGSINTQAYPLGYVNLDGKALIASRSPTRMWKVGLCSRNLHVKQIYHDRVRPDRGFLVSRALARCILNEYPKYASCLDKLGSLCKPLREPSMAFSRRFAMLLSGGDSWLYYKTFSSPIGKVIKGEPFLDKKFQYLQQALEEDMKR